MAGRGHQVAITGLGIVSPVGTGIDAFWAGLHAPAASGTSPRPVVDFEPTDHLVAKAARRLDRFAQLAVAAADLAVADAGLAGEDGLAMDDREQAGTIVATGVGGIPAYEDQLEVLRTKGARRVSPFLIPMLMPNAASAQVSMRFGTRGPCETVTTACAAGTHALGWALEWIRSGRCDVVLAGGTEAMLTPAALASFTNMTAISSRGISQPFDVSRDGFVPGEGSAILVLERLEHAAARGARIYALLAGAASTADAHHITAPDPAGAGAASCLRRAIADAGLVPSDIRHVNAHGTSTPLNDAAEAAAIATVLGDGDEADAPVVAVKGVTGHLLGAAGAVEAAALALTIERGQLPPTGGVVELDRSLPVDVVYGAPRAWTPGPAISSSFGFGGHNACVVLTPA